MTGSRRNLPARSVTGSPVFFATSTATSACRMDSLQRFPPSDSRVVSSRVKRASSCPSIHTHTKYAKNSNMSRSIRVFWYSSLSSTRMVSRYADLTLSLSRSGEDRPNFCRTTVHINSYGASVLTSVTSTSQYSATRASSHDTQRTSRRMRRATPGPGPRRAAARVLRAGRRRAARLPPSGLNTAPARFGRCMGPLICCYLGGSQHCVIYVYMGSPRQPRVWCRRRPAVNDRRAAEQEPLRLKAHGPFTPTACGDWLNRERTTINMHSEGIVQILHRIQPRLSSQCCQRWVKSR